MLRKMFISALTFVITIGLYGMSVSAAPKDVPPELAKIIYNKTAKTTRQNLLEISRPDGNETIFDNTYTICGISKEDGIRVKVLILKEFEVDEKKTERYIDFKEEDSNKSSWDLVSKDILIKEFDLKNGVNELRIVAWKKSDPSVYQISNFTIKVLEGKSKNNVVSSKKDNRIGIGSIIDFGAYED